MHEPKSNWQRRVFKLASLRFHQPSVWHGQKNYRRSYHRREVRSRCPGFRAPLDRGAGCGDERQFRRGRSRHRGPDGSIGRPSTWGPGKYDAELDQDGKGFRPDGKSAATLIPAAYGLAGVNLHTYNGWGSVTYWNAYVANTQMHGKGTFFDPRIQNNPDQSRSARR